MGEGGSSTIKLACGEKTLVLSHHKLPLRVPRLTRFALSTLSITIFTCKYTHTPKSLQCLRLTAIPNQNARHDPCPGTDLAKPLSPLETLALTSLDQTIMVLLCSIRFWSNPIGTPVSNGPFFVGTVDAHKQKREAGPFPSLYTAEWVLIKEKNEVQNEVKTRYGKSPASTHMDFGPQAANLPFLGSLVAKQWQFAESQHTAMAV